MTFAQNLNRICKERGTNLTTLCKEMGISTSKVSAINNGSIPKEKTMLEFADRLDCSVMDFFSDEEDLEPKDGDERDILRIFRSLSRRERHEFMTMVYDYEKKHELDGDKENSSAV